ncbi:MAG: BLUF domain-containing protein [Polaromonas sp.]
MSKLHSIVYTSASVSPMNSGDLDALLVDARNFNRQNEITGVLLHSGSNFMQCFEGPEEAVQRVYQRILGSRKHTDVVEFMNLPVQQRTFSDWAMGSAMTTPSELLALSTATWNQLSSELAFSPFTPPGLAILQVFWSMRQSSP